MDFPKFVPLDAQGLKQLGALPFRWVDARGIVNASAVREAGRMLSAHRPVYSASAVYSPTCGAWVGRHRGRSGGR